MKNSYQHHERMPSSVLVAASCMFMLTIGLSIDTNRRPSYVANAFQIQPPTAATTTMRRLLSPYSKNVFFSTVEAPPRERTDKQRKTGGGGGGGGGGRGEEDEDSRRYNENYDDTTSDLEYLIDGDESRDMEDPFHILLMGSTFEKPKITVTYVSGSLEYVLNMPYDDAMDLAQFAHDEGMSCLGTWPREECLKFGKQLQMRDIVCRVVPYVQGGQRPWQAKDVSSSNAGSSSSNNQAWN